MKNKKTDLAGILILTLTALIWGSAFVAQSVGMDYVGPITFNMARFYIGGIVLIPSIFVIKKITRANENTDKQVLLKQRKNGFIGGICCGICLCIASLLQQIGIMGTTVGKAGFITALYIVIVPILSIALGRKTKLIVWISVLIAIAGMYLLCINEGFTISKGDFYVFLCAIAFSIHILVIDHFTPMADGTYISCVQFFTAAVLSTILAIIFEGINIEGILLAAKPILYAGVFSCGIAYTLQIVGQRRVNPSIAPMILSLESVFSLLSGWIILGQSLSLRELFGCLLVFAAIILAQL